jgi:hypothetical protein
VLTGSDLAYYANSRLRLKREPAWDLNLLPCKDGVSALWLDLLFSAARCGILVLLWFVMDYEAWFHQVTNCLTVSERDDVV